jgi:hypothetical protein
MGCAPKVRFAIDSPLPARSLLPVSAGHSLGAADRIALDQAADDLDSTAKRNAVHRRVAGVLGVAAGDIQVCEVARKQPLLMVDDPTSTAGTIPTIAPNIPDTPNTAAADTKLKARRARLSRWRHVARVSVPRKTHIRRSVAFLATQHRRIKKHQCERHHTRWPLA